MAIKATITLKGGLKLERTLRELPKRVANKVVSKSLRAGAKVTQQATKAAAPVRTGLLKSSIKVRATKRKKGRIGIAVQIKGGDYKGKAFYGSFIEYGYRKGKRGRGLKRAQAQLARWIGRDASSSKRGGVLKRILRSEGVVKSDSREKVAGKFFMRGAFESTVQQAADVIAKQMAAGIEREAKK